MFRGSVVAKIVGYNVLARPEKFVREVPMYVYEEMIDGRKLTEIINTQHENVKYLPGCILPDNVVGLCLLIILLLVRVHLLICLLIIIWRIFKTWSGLINDQGRNFGLKSRIPNYQFRRRRTCYGEHHELP